MGEDAIWQSTVKLNHGGSLLEIALMEEGHAGGQVHMQNPKSLHQPVKAESTFRGPLCL